HAVGLGGDRVEQHRGLALAVDHAGLGGIAGAVLLAVLALGIGGREHLVARAARGLQASAEAKGGGGAGDGVAKGRQGRWGGGGHGRGKGVEGGAAVGKVSTAEDRRSWIAPIRAEWIIRPYVTIDRSTVAATARPSTWHPGGPSSARWTGPRRTNIT